MLHVFFELQLTTKKRSIGPYWLIINAIQELIFPGLYNVPKHVLEIAKRYDGTDAWFMISSLGPNHRHPFTYYNGVVETWSEYTLSQVMSTRAFGSVSTQHHTPQRCA